MRFRLGFAFLVTAVLTAGCGFGGEDMTCKEYRDAGTDAKPTSAQTAVIKDHIKTDVPEPELEISLAHQSVVYWCNKRDAEEFFEHDDDNVGDYLDEWK